MAPPDGVGAVTMRLKKVGDTAHQVDIGANTATLHLDSRWNPFLRNGCEITILKYKISWLDGGVHFHVTNDEDVLLHHSTSRGLLNTMEVFAGLGGWSQAAKGMNVNPVLLVDWHGETAHACAKRLQCPVMTASEYMQAMFRGDDPSVVVLHDRVENPATWAAAGLANVAYVLGSPPCPPWSGAASQKGLACEGGLAFQVTLNFAALSQIRLVVLENVAGLMKHEDFKVMVRDAKEKGLALTLSGSLSVSCFT